MPNRNLRTAIFLALGGLASSASLHAAEAAKADGKSQWHTIETYCLKCHNTDDWAGKLAFDTLGPDKVVEEAKVFEATIRKLKGGLMPPPGNERPPQQEITALANWIEHTIDAAADKQVAGRVPLHRLNRREYTNAVRDLLGLEVKVDKYLPTDNVKNGFDNNAEALQVSPAFIDQYLTAARSIAHDAIGDRRPIPIMETYGSVADMIISLPARGIQGIGPQQRHTEGMPFGTRGGISVNHTFMADGEYELTIGDLALAREVPNMEFENTVVALLDGKEFFRTVVGGERDHKWIDQILDDAVAQINERLRKIHFFATAGQHNITVTFLQRSFAESDELTPATALEGGQARLHGLHAMQIRGPLKVTGMSDSQSRKKIFVCYPKEKTDEAACAEQIVTQMAERAFRRPLTDQDKNELMAFYQKTRSTNADFEAGIEAAMSAILVSPHFLYRAETGSDSKGTLALNDFELASRLSFFLWSSVPDDELLTVANKGQLRDAKVLKAQVTRMLKDDRAKSLITDFSAQWLNLAKMDEITPNAGQYRFASGRLDVRPLLKEELNLFIDSVLRSDQSVTRLLDADYTFINERLAMLYGMSDIKGSKMRKVQITDPNRRGLLGKGGILLATANPNRTSPVLRGAWILDRILGTPPASPPPGVEALQENGFGKPAKTVRERLEQHRSKPTCLGCHGVMDPLGMALENFNTLGQFRVYDPDTLTKIDASGVLPDGKPLQGPQDLIQALLARSDMFVETLTHNLMTFALGRELDHRDMPAVRKIARAAAKDGNRFDSIVYNIIQSDAFKMRDGAISSSETQAKPQQASL